MSKTIIGIPVHNDLESLRSTIESIFFSLPKETYNLIFIESESTDGASEYCDELSKNYKHIETIHIKKEGPLKAYNRLFKIAIERECDLLLSQTDVVYPWLYKRSWLNELKNLANIDEVSISTCINGGGVSGPDYIDGLNWVGGWCTYIPIKTLKHLKEFDEDFPNGFGVDIDLTYRALKLGKIGVINYWVDHHMTNERTHDNDKDSEKMKKEASEYFKLKWGIK